jgi:hypothetical protein
MHELDQIVPSVRAGQHVEMLRSKYLLSTVAIGHLAGINHGIIDHTIYPLNGPTRRFLTARQEKAILAVEFNLDDLADLPGTTISPVGTQRRLKALGRIGWSMGYLGERLGGVSVSAVSSHIKPERKHVTVRVALDVKALYDELSMKLGPAQAAVKQATRRRWAPPWAWDDDTIDDPDVLPDLACLNRPTVRSSVETIEDVRWILDHKPIATMAEVAERLGIARDGLTHLLRRADEQGVPGIQEIRNQFYRNTELLGRAVSIRAEEAS